MKNNEYDIISFDEDLKLNKVNFENKLNYIDENGNLFFDKWLSCSDINYIPELDLFHIQGNNKKETLINKDGTAFFKEWYDKVVYDRRKKLIKTNLSFGYFPLFQFGFLEKTTEWFNKKGELVSIIDTYIDSVISRIYILTKNKKKAIVKNDNQIKSKLYYDNIRLDKINGEILVKDNGLYNLLNIDNKPIFKDWFYRIKLADNIRKRFIVEVKKGEYNIINYNGGYILDENVENINYYKDADFYNISKNNKNYLIDSYANVILEGLLQFFDITNGLILVDGKYNILSNNNKLILKDWHYDISYIENLDLFLGLKEKPTLNKKAEYELINYTGENLFKKKVICDSIKYDVHRGLFYVMVNGEDYFINLDGEKVNNFVEDKNIKVVYDNSVEEEIYK